MRTFARRKPQVVAAPRSTLSRAPARPAQSTPRFGHDFTRVGVQSPRVSTTDAWDEYQKTGEEIAQFQAGAPYFFINYRANCFFDAIYLPPNFNIVVKVAFAFYPTDPDLWGKDTKTEDVTWTKGEEDAWKARYLAAVSAKWTNEKFVLFCTKPGWENLTAQVVVRFVDVETTRAAMPFVKSSIQPHYRLAVSKIPPGRRMQSETRGPNAFRAFGEVDLDSQGLEPLKSSTGHQQRPAVHESGHMLGLADLYVKGNPKKQAEFQERAKTELGAPVPIADDGRFMSVGETFDVPDAITFVEAIRATTGLPWSLFHKRSRPIPHAPEDINDLVGPKETVV